MDEIMTRKEQAALALQCQADPDNQRLRSRLWSTMQPYAFQIWRKKWRYVERETIPSMSFFAITNALRSFNASKTSWQSYFGLALDSLLQLESVRTCALTIDDPTTAQGWRDFKSTSGAVVYIDHMPTDTDDNTTLDLHHIPDKTKPFSLCSVQSRLIVELRAMPHTEYIDRLMQEVMATPAIGLDLLADINDLVRRFYHNDDKDLQRKRPDVNKQLDVFQEACVEAMHKSIGSPDTPQTERCATAQILRMERIRNAQRRVT